MTPFQPAGYSSISPYLIVRDGEAAIRFYAKVLDATERMRLPGPGGRIGHAELVVGDAVIMLADEAPEHSAFAPPEGGTHHLTLHVYVPDADAAIEAALQAGAKLLRPVETKFYGDRLGTILDPFGHIWHLSTHVEDLSPDELQRRTAAQIGPDKEGSQDPG